MKPRAVKSNQSSLAKACLKDPATIHPDSYRGSLDPYLS